MHDIGILTLLRELGRPYAKLLSGVIESGSDLAAFERDSLGFDHVELSAALMKQWHLPQRLIDAVATPKQLDRLAHAISVDADLARILHLADLLAQLVGQRRGKVLPELLEAGGAYRDLTKGRLAVLVEKLQPQVEQLAAVMSVELAGERNYVEVLAAAHERMSSLAEEFAGQLRHHRSEDEVYTELLHEAQELTVAMKTFLEGKQQCEEIATSAAVPAPKKWHAPHERTRGARAAAEEHNDNNSRHHVAVETLVGSVAPLPRAAARVESGAGGIELPERSGDGRPRRYPSVLRDAFETCCRAEGGDDVQILPITAVQLAAILPNCERRQAITLANEVLGNLGDAAEPGIAAAMHAATFSVGVATVAAMPKNFDPWRLVESAERCLYAARSCNTNTVKSIEI